MTFIMGLRLPKYEALIAVARGDEIIIVRKGDTKQIANMGDILSSYWGTEGRALELVSWGSLLTVFPANYDLDPRYDEADIYPWVGESREDVEVLAELEELDTVFLFEDGKWRVGKFVESGKEFDWSDV